MLPLVYHKSFNHLVRQKLNLFRLCLWLAHKDCVGLGKFRLQGFELGKFKLHVKVVGARYDYPAAVARYLQTVGAGSLVRRGDKYARCAVVKYAGRRNIVLDVYLSANRPCDSVDADNLAACKPSEQVKLVRILIDKHSAAFACPSASPSALRIIRLRSVPISDYPYHSFEIAQLSRFDDFLSRLIDLACPLVVQQTKTYAGSFCLCILRNLSHSLGIHACRLVAKHVDIALQRLARDNRMLIVRRIYYKRVYKTAVKQIFMRVKNLDLVAKLAYSPAPSLFVAVAYRRQHRILVHTCKQLTRVSAALFADTYNAVSHLVHNQASFSAFAIISFNP